MHCQPARRGQAVGGRGRQVEDPPISGVHNQTPAGVARLLSFLPAGRAQQAARRPDRRALPRVWG